MKTEKILRKLGLSQLDFDDVKQTVQKVEKTTSGEIAVALIGESSDYSFFELLFSVICGALTFSVMLPFYSNISAWFDRMLWQPHSWYVTAFYGFVSFAVIALMFLIVNIPAVDRLIVPHKERSRRVYFRALRHFVQSGIYATKDRSGILIFVSLLEREVQIIADTGISSKIPQENWDKIASDIAFGFRSGLGAAALQSAIERCGSILTEHFPSSRINPNELSDEVVILENEQ